MENGALYILTIVISRQKKYIQAASLHLDFGKTSIIQFWNMSHETKWQTLYANYY